MVVCVIVWVDVVVDVTVVVRGVRNQFWMSAAELVTVVKPPESGRPLQLMAVPGPTIHDSALQLGFL